MSNHNHDTKHMTAQRKPDRHGDTDLIATMDLHDDQIWEGLTAMIASLLKGTGLTNDEAITVAYQGLHLARTHITHTLMEPVDKHTRRAP